MNISFKPIGTGAWTVLLDEAAGGTVEKWTPSSSQRNQAEALASSGAPGSQFTKFLGNTLVTLAFKGNVQYSDRGSALAATRTIFAALQQGVHLRVIEPTGTAETQYYPNATIETVTPDVQGVSVDWSFVFKAQSVTSVAPL